MVGIIAIPVSLIRCDQLWFAGPDNCVINQAKSSSSHLVGKVSLMRRLLIMLMFFSHISSQSGSCRSGNGLIFIAFIWCIFFCLKNLSYV